ncbi:MAG: polyprenyl diphosphate synthase [Candidatus Diapherotrites archaeon]
MDGKGYHLGLIPDGNRRWAISRGLDPKVGHKKGAENMEKLVDWAIEHKEIREFSVYALSEENFKRSKDELANLFNIYYEGIDKLLHSEELHKNNVKVNIISTRHTGMPKNLLELCKQIKSETKFYGNKVMNILIGYTGQSEILKSVSSPMNRIKNLIFGLNENDVRRYLGVQSNCDFIIRTGYEEKPREAKSGFLLWQSAYSEYYHINKYWPDVTKKDLDEAWNYFLNTRRMKGL